MSEFTKLAQEKFNALTYPTKKEQDWRFADLSVWNKKNIEHYLQKEDKQDLQIERTQDSNSHIYLNDNILKIGLLSDAILVCPLKEAIKNDPELYKKFYKQNLTKFESLQASKADRGIYIKVLKNTSLSLDIEAKNKFESVGFLFDVAEDVGLNLSCKMELKAGALGLYKFAFNCKSASQLKICMAEFSDKEAMSYVNIEYYLDSLVNIDDALLKAGFAPNRTKKSFYLNGENSVVDSRNFISAKDENIADLRTFQKHNVAKTASSLEVRTMLEDYSKLAYTGLIDIEEQSSQSKAYQSAKTILLSDTAISQAEPILQIKNFDVECSHGCTVAKPDAEEIFYLRQRGLNLHEAHSLLNRGLAEKTFEKILDKDFVAAILSKVF